MDTIDCRGYRDSCDLDCSCTSFTGKAVLPDRLSVAMAYIPFQQWQGVCSADAGLQAGTMFPCLKLPFTGCLK